MPDVLTRRNYSAISQTTQAHYSRLDIPAYDDYHRRCQPTLDGRNTRQPVGKTDKCAQDFLRMKSNIDNVKKLTAASE
jgi:hypothetical protein